MMDPNLILRAGQTADILGAMQTGNALAAQTNQIRQQNALARLYQDHGSSLMDGNTESLNKLAQIDPNAALGIQRDRMNMDVSQHNMDMGRRQDARAEQQFGLQQQQWQMKVQDYARGLSAEQASAEAQQIEAAVKMGLAAQSPEQWDQIVKEAKAPHLVGQFESRRMLINQYLEAADIIRGGGGGDYGLTPVFGTDENGNPVLMQIGKGGDAVRTQLPEGVIGVDLGIQAQERAAGTMRGRLTAEAQLDLPTAISKAERAIENLVAVRDDPALASITGMIQGRMPPMTQSGTDLNTRIEQAQGQAFLEAFESLKGGGQITEVEGQKATAAMARLNRAQSAEAYQAALNEMIDVLNTGIGRARGRAGEPDAPAQISDDDLLKKYGG